MTVRITQGVAYVTGTPTGGNSQTVRVNMASFEDVTIPANVSGSTRTSWLYIKLDPAKLANPAVDASDVATLIVSDSSNAVTDDGTTGVAATYKLLIGKVTVANGAVSITNANITDSRTRTGSNFLQVSNNTDFGALNSSGVLTQLLKLGSDNILRLGQVRFQNDNSDSITSSTQQNVVVQFGWGQKLGTASASMTETVTFPTAFTSILFFQAAPLGAKSTTAMTSITDMGTSWGGSTGIGHIDVSALSTSTATINLNRNSAFTNTFYWAYSWVAVGTI